MLLKIRLAAPGDGRKKVKAVIRTADSWLSDGNYDAARCLYEKALEMAKAFKSHHLAKVASKRLTDVERSRQMQSGA